MAGNRDVRKAYRVILLGLFSVTLLLTAGGGYAVWSFTDTPEQSALLARVGFWLLRIVGLVLVFFAAPLLAITICNLLFPVFSEIPFMAGLRALDRRRADALQLRPGLPLSATIFNSIRRFFLFLLITSGCFLLGLVPVVGPLLAAPVQFYLSARTLGWEMLDPYFDRCGLGWADQKQILKARAPEILGLGVVCAPLLAIPLVGPLFFGLLQAGTAGFVIETFDESEFEAPLIPSKT